MAHQSAAFGEIIISTKNKEDLQDFIYLQLLSEKGHHITQHYLKYLTLIVSTKKKYPTY